MLTPKKKISFHTDLHACDFQPKGNLTEVPLL